MANQYLAIYEEEVRGEAPVAPATLFVPVISGIEPAYKVKDEPRKEFRGADTALGNTSVVRRDSEFEVKLQAAFYPGKELGLLLKHAIGFAGARSVVDTTAYKGILFPKSAPYGDGNPLSTTAVALVPNTDRDGTTVSQVFGGARFKAVTFSVKPSSDVTIDFEGSGAGGWVGDPNQAATAGASFPTVAPYVSNDVKFYIGAGATRTGVAPNYTALAPNTMKQIIPDEATIKITNGLADVAKLNGVSGPSVTQRNGQYVVEIDMTLDFTDPASGFSSIDEYEALFGGQRTNSIMVVFSHPELAGDATEHYAAIIDVPLAMVAADAPTRDNEGKQTKVKFKFTSLYSDTTKYPVALLLTDKSDSY